MHHRIGDSFASTLSENNNNLSLNYENVLRILKNSKIGIDDSYDHFVEICKQSFSIIQNRCRFIFNLFRLMLPSKMPELITETDILYLKNVLFDDFYKTVILIKERKLQETQENTNININTNENNNNNNNNNNNEDNNNNDNNSNSKDKEKEKEKEKENKNMSNVKLGTMRASVHHLPSFHGTTNRSHFMNDSYSNVSSLSQHQLLFSNAQQLTDEDLKSYIIECLDKSHSDKIRIYDNAAHAIKHK